MLRKKITIGASASARSRQTSRSTLECTGDSEGRTASIAVRPRNPRPVPITFYRDEIFDVTVTVSGTPHYVGTLELELCKGKKEQTLGSRGKVKMHDFGIEQVDQNSNRRLITDVTQLRFESKHEGERTFKAVINMAQTVRIKATEVINSDGDLNESLSAETDDIYIAHSLRQYTTEHGDANQYDSYIDKWVGYWDDWKIPVQTDKVKAPEHHTFMTDAVPSGDLVKAVTYKESTMSTVEAGENLMQVREPALIGMNTNHPKKEDDVHGGGLGHDYAGGAAGDGRQTMKYRVPTVVTIFDDSFQWGIRWLIAKRTRFNDSGAVKVRDWWDPTGAAKWYNREKGKQVSYPLSVEKLYAEGRYPHTEAGAPGYLWPIKVDKTAREDDANPPAETPADTPENPPEETPENPPAE